MRRLSPEKCAHAALKSGAQARPPSDAAVYWAVLEEKAKAKSKGRISPASLSLICLRHARVVLAVAAPKLHLSTFFPLRRKRPLDQAAVCWQRTAEAAAERIKERESSRRISRVLWAQLGREGGESRPLCAWQACRHGLPFKGRYAGLLYSTRTSAWQAKVRR